jgi:hypothetical protein
LFGSITIIIVINLFESQHFVEQGGQEHQVDAGERLLCVGDLARVLQGILKTKQLKTFQFHIFPHKLQTCNVILSVNITG